MKKLGFVLLVLSTLGVFVCCWASDVFLKSVGWEGLSHEQQFLIDRLCNLMWIPPALCMLGGLLITAGSLRMKSNAGRWWMLIATCSMLALGLSGWLALFINSVLFAFFLTFYPKEKGTLTDGSVFLDGMQSDSGCR